MLCNQLVLVVCELYKVVLWGFVQQVLVIFSEYLDIFYQLVVCKVLWDNLLLVMGMMLEEVQLMVSVESVSYQSYCCLLVQVCEYVLENSVELLIVFDLCQQLYVSCCILQNVFYVILGIGFNVWFKWICLNVVCWELISFWLECEMVKEVVMQWGFWYLGQFVIDYQQLFVEKLLMMLYYCLCQWV